MMQNFLAIAKIVVLAALAVLLTALAMFLVFLALQVKTTGGKVDAAIDEMTQTTAEARKRLVDTSQNMNVILIQSGLAADEARRAAIEQRAYWNQAGAETVTAIRQIQQTTKSVDDSQKQIAQATVMSLQSLQPAAQASTEAMQQAANDLESLNKILADQNIAQLIEHLKQTAAHLDSM